MKISKRRGFVLLAIAAALILTLLLAPGRDRVLAGSTYSRGPDGYGAWYAFMEERGTPIQRWQRPLKALDNKEPMALLRVFSDFELFRIDPQTQSWIEKGNTLVTLGMWQPVSEAPFSSQLDTPQGAVKIETRRRAEVEEGEKELLQDLFGAVVWEKTLGKGRAIWVTTPYLAANAYQEEPGNYEFLAQLLAETGQSLWVDEYLHGYRDADGEEEGEETLDLWGYLARTPLLPIFVQGCIILLVAIAAQNRRFGSPQALEAPDVNNSQAYIQALASVLRKAKSSDFALETVGKAEQVALQERLGLGSTPLEFEAVLQAWQEQTGQDAGELKVVLPRFLRRRWRSERELLVWLEKWEKIRATDGLSFGDAKSALGRGKRMG